MKYFTLALSSLLLSSAVAKAADEENALTPEKKCERMLENFGDNRAVTIFFNYSAWGVKNRGVAAPLSEGLALASVDSAYVDKSRETNKTNCVKSATGANIRLTLYVEPKLALLPQPIGNQFSIPMNLSLTPDGAGNNVSVSFDNFQPLCLGVLENRLKGYFLDGIKDSSGNQIQRGRATAFNHVEGMDPTMRTALEGEAKSYCSNLENELKKTAIEQFSDRI